MRRLQQILARMREIQEELREAETLESAHGTDPDTNPLPEGHAERVANLVDEFRNLDTERAPLQEAEEARQAVLGAALDGTHAVEDGDGVRAGAPHQIRHADPFDVTTLRWGASTDEVRSRALTALEHTDRSGLLTTDQRDELVRKIEGRRGDSGGVKDERGVIPGMVLRMGSDAYLRAFTKALAGRQAEWTGDERAAMVAANEFRTHMGLTDANGGYGVPTHLDPTLILTGGGSANPFRSIARVETITTDAWNGLSSSGVTAGFAAEATQAGDNSPTFAGPSVVARRAQAFAAGSIEITQDYVGLAADLQTMFLEAKDDLEATKFVKGAGSGSNEPIGITTALDGTASEVAPTTGETFAVSDVFRTLDALPPKYRSAAARTAWIHNAATLSQIRELLIAEDGGAQGVLQDFTAGAPRQLLEVDRWEASAMDSSRAINPAVTADNFILVVGDWRNYVIADRVGMTVEYVPHLFGVDRRPTGERGWYCFWRVGADSVNDNAFRMLSIPTTA